VYSPSAYLSLVASVNAKGMLVAPPGFPIVISQLSVAAELEHLVTVGCAGPRTGGPDLRADGLEKDAIAAKGLSQQHTYVR
jgi:hypothetical protein